MEFIDTKSTCPPHKNPFRYLLPTLIGYQKHHRSSGFDKTFHSGTTEVTSTKTIVAKFGPNICLYLGQRWR